MGLPFEHLMDRWDVHREELAYTMYYTIHWSPWGSMDRWVINRLVPSEAGIFQLWVLKGKDLLLLITETAYFGGIRNSLREIIDDLAPAGERLRKLISGRECWFRFSISSVREYLKDLDLWFSRKTYEEKEREIYVREIEEFKKFQTPPPDIQLSSRKRLKDSLFGPPMPKFGK